MRVRSLARNLVKLFWLKLAEAFMEAEDVDREHCQVAGAAVADAMRSQPGAALRSAFSLTRLLLCPNDLLLRYIPLPNRSLLLSHRSSLNFLWHYMEMEDVN